MSEVSTPRRRSLLPSVGHTPFRKNGDSGAPSSIYLDPVDEEQDRVKRRSVLAIQRRLTNVTPNSSFLSDNSIIEESQLKDTIILCTKLHTENRISSKNAWQLQIIDAIRKIVGRGSDYVLQVAGTSLDIGAKVYGLRVDDVYAKGLQLASSMAKNKEVDTENPENDTSINHNEKKKSTRKKIKKMSKDKRNIIDKEERSFLATIKHIDSVIFATKESIEVNATDNLFTNKLCVIPSAHQLALLCQDKYFSTKDDKILDTADALLEIDSPTITNFNTCRPFKDFDLESWDVQNEDELLFPAASSYSEPVLDENGFPIAELDGSVHDIFEDNVGVPDDPEIEGDDEQEIFQAQLHGEIGHVVDAIPEEYRRETDYSYNTLIKNNSGKYIEKIWAGPSFWKVKSNKKSLAKYSGSEQVVVKQLRKNKSKIPLTFEDMNKNEVKWKAHAPKRSRATTTMQKITLPIPAILILKQIGEFFIKPGVPRPRIVKLEQEICESQEDNVDYNYENLNDSQYCSQIGGDDVNNDGGTFEEQEIPVAHQQLVEENFVDAPELVATSRIPYAMVAKKMDMKKLKSAVWKIVSQNKGNTVQPLQLSTLYGELPRLLSTDMQKELTFPLALIALLHLCNEHNLELQQKSDKGCVIIVPN